MFLKNLIYELKFVIFFTFWGFYLYFISLVKKVPYALNGIQLFCTTTSSIIILEQNGVSNGCQTCCYDAAIHLNLYVIQDHATKDFIFQIVPQKVILLNIQTDFNRNSSIIITVINSSFTTYKQKTLATKKNEKKLKGKKF